MDILNEHAKLLKTFTQGCYESTNELFGGDWEEMFYDVRLDPTAPGAYMSRAVVKRKSEREKFFLPFEVEDVVTDLLTLRGKLGNSKWFGFILRLDPEGNCDTTYSYDPDYIDSFVDDDEAEIPF